MSLELTDSGGRKTFDLSFVVQPADRLEGDDSLALPTSGGSDGTGREINLRINAVDILATRGESTDSFARVMMVSDNDTEFEMGRTEVATRAVLPRRVATPCDHAAS